MDGGRIMSAFEYLWRAKHDLNKADWSDQRLDQFRVKCEDGTIVTLQHVHEWINAVGNHLEQGAIASGQPQHFRERPKHTERRANGRFSPRRYG